MASAPNPEAPGAPRSNGTAPDSTDTCKEVAIVIRSLEVVRDA